MMKMRTRNILAFIMLVFAVFSALFFKLSSTHNRKFAKYNHPIILAIEKPEEQILALENQLKNDPQSFLASAALASAYLSDGKASGDPVRFEQAEQIAKRSLKIFSFHNDRPWVVLADLAQARHEFTTAVELSKKLIADPAVKRGIQLEALSILITSHLALGQLAEASMASDQLVDSDPSMESYILRALVDEAQGKDEEVEFDYHSAYADESFGHFAESAKLRCFWARYRMRRGDRASARALLAEAMRLQPLDPLVFSLLGELEIREEKYALAKSHFERAFELSKQTVFLLGKARAENLLGEKEESKQLTAQTEKILKSALDLTATGKPSAFVHRSELIKLYLERRSKDDLPAALNLAKEEIKSRRSAETLYILASAYFECDQFTGAQTVIRELFRTGVKQAEYFALGARIEKSLLHNQKAEFYNQMALKTDPGFKAPEFTTIEKGARVVSQ